MKKLYFLVLVLTFFYGDYAKGQQISRTSQFVVNPYIINPAVAGTQNQIPLFLNYRTQWAGFTGAPTFINATGHFQGPENSGFGAIISRDNMGGAITKTYLELTGAYHIELNNYDAVSFGLSVVGGQYVMDNSIFKVYDKDDPSLNGGVSESVFNVDAKFGMMIYGVDYYFGFAVPNLFQTGIKLESPFSPENYNARHYHIMGAYNYQINNDWDVQPSGIMRFTQMTPVQFDANIRFGYQQTVWGGITYRHNDALAVNLGGMYENFYLGYSYDITTTRARVMSPHTHEIMVGYIIPGKRGVYQPRSTLGPPVIPRSRKAKK
ncbi:MAG TPA: type IX secretion system membrane protein PorP/SprF [Flavobacteriales bacterium]|jgi:type IX secretion system PorP/SprF family membrane protein